MLSSTSDSASLTVKLPGQVCRQHGVRPRQRARGESSLCWCLPLQRRGAAEWDQCKPRLTPPTLCLTSGSGEGEVGGGQGRWGWGAHLPLTQEACLYAFCLREHLKHFNHLKSSSFPSGCAELPQAGADWAERAREQVKQEIHERDAWGIPFIDYLLWKGRLDISEMLFSDLKNRFTVWKLWSVCRTHNHTHNSIFLGCAICDATTCNLEKSLPVRIKIYMLAKNASSD